MKNNILKINGGKREGSGRKLGTGKFSEPTIVSRLPISQVPMIKDFLAAYQRKKLLESMDTVADFKMPAIDLTSIALPLFSSKVPAGFPSPAEEHIEKRLDPNDFLIDQKDATFFVTIQGYSMIDVGLMPNDVAVIDRSKIATIGDIVLALVDGEYTIKILNRKKDGTPRLLPANNTGAFAPIEIKDGMTFEVWGVVISSFRRFK
ncbi:LexA SOS-response transcriptional repressors (RecA-mediated autopeptidases) [Methylophilaceae bacterium]